MFCSSLLKQVENVLAACRARGVMIATAESCTGGLIASVLTEVAGSSDVVDRGFVTYSNEAKSEMLGVPMVLIEQHGSVSEAVARAMAEGAIAKSRAQISVAVTGVAGPSGGSDAKPVGMVHLACAYEGQETQHCVEVFEGERHEVRMQTVWKAIEMMMQYDCHPK